MKTFRHTTVIVNNWDKPTKITIINRDRPTVYRVVSGIAAYHLAQTFAKDIASFNPDPFPAPHAEPAGRK